MRCIPLLGLLALGAALSLAAPAAASGPVERMQQVMPVPGKPDALVVRFGLASHGFLYSEDAGKTFRALCSSAVAPELASSFERLSKITLRSIAGTAAVIMDGAGQVLFSQYPTPGRGGDSMWMSDGSGCEWSSVDAFKDRWAFSMKADPRDPNVLWAAVSAPTGEGDEIRADAEMWRRDASGEWAPVGRLLSLTAGNIVYDGDLVVYGKGDVTRLYVTVDVGGLTGAARHVLMSEDGGKSWHDTQLDPAYQNLNLLAVDPIDPDRLLAALPRDGESDRLLISSDRGVTFTDYAGDLRVISGVTFDPTGRVFVGDAGDASSADAVGGLYTAAKLGDPLIKIENTDSIDCVNFDAPSNRLYVCQADKVGIADPVTGAVRVLVTISTVPEILSCPGRDLVEECKAQFNDGPSWCCAGHYPFTPFCGQYDVTETPDARRVLCGKTGREYDTPPDAGGVSDPSAADAGALPLGLSQPGAPLRTLGDEPTGARVRGCSVSGADTASALGALGFGFSLLSLALRRRRRHA